ncbi:PhzF family phenazine biosynthesis protein [Nonomuraea sp. C10]|uniref:PhzF family phenazine biosynthesis protein n=1 Tax=Nonomuraea sp. C10 TaxID=2600577 RepID=UPI0011CEB09E|nr:PhzF family phenazine biosynthesis protein [Nonomuraea sp. C10]TXK39341.1 PhzF family phenazine biosynthesis protein [Nonomuraea sp. C10]
MGRAFRQVDVFTDTAYHGNPLAVVVDGAGLTDEEMGRFANWTNLSETTFLLPPSTGEADYRVRIFTPSGELPFAGHPTIGSCHAWLETGGAPRDPGMIVQECAAGLVRVRRDGSGLAFAAPPLLRSGPVDEDLLGRLADGLGIGRGEIADAEWADNGPGWVALLLRDADAVLALRPGRLPVDTGVAGLYPEGSPYAYEVRAFCPYEGGIVEDPVTGSLNASLAQWLLRTGRVTAPYAASQGTALGRVGRVRISADDTGVWVGGSAVTCVTGVVTL